MNETPPGGAAGAELVCDTVVVGSGAAGLVAAITARLAGLDVTVIEKEAVFGGTSAVSGGWLWIPNNPVSARAKISDSKVAARNYIESEAGEYYDADRVEAFLEAGPEMVTTLTNHGIKFINGAAFCDYHPDAPGAVTGNRAICAAPMDGRLLGKEIKRLRPPLRENTLFGMMIGSGRELSHFFNMRRSPKSALRVGHLIVSYGYELLTYGRAIRLTNGNALIGRLAKLAFDLGVPIWTGESVDELVTEGGAVVGARLTSAVGGRRTIIARRGVVLATGGFPRDAERVARSYPHVADGARHVTAAPVGDGSGMRLGESVGGVQLAALANAGAWTPVSLVPRRSGPPGVFPHFIDRAKPGLIAVLSNGDRFTNEADSYHDFVSELITAARRNNQPVRAFLIMDHRAIRRYGLGYVKPEPVPLRSVLRSGYLKRGRTIVELAETLGIDAMKLKVTIDDYNIGAAIGEDRRFGRGGNAYNRSLGDPSHKPNPCVAPIQHAPFYAVEVLPGDVGTFAGLIGDAQARVLDKAGRPIPGLYAAGADLATINGGAYPGGGTTLGPAMTFGYVAARHMAAGKSEATYD